jgi:hypothetical protein
MGSASVGATVHATEGQSGPRRRAARPGRPPLALPLLLDASPGHSLTVCLKLLQWLKIFCIRYRPAVFRLHSAALRSAQVINECRRRKIQLEHYTPDVRTVEVDKVVDYSKYIGDAAFLELVRNLDGAPRC